MILDAVHQVWPPFVLVTGLLLIGRAAAADGLFEALGARLAGAPFGPRVLLAALLGLVAVVTAVLNLDTAAAFLTPVLVHAARQRRLDERPFLYGGVFMSNSASLLLPGSNLTNMIVFSGAGSASRMLLPWLASCAITTIFVTLALPTGTPKPWPHTRPRVPLSASTVAVGAAAALVVAQPNPALPVLAVGLAVTGLRRRRASRVDLRPLAALFALAVAVGALGRAWDAPFSALTGLGAAPTALVAATLSVLVNNLPAAALLSAHAPAHPVALLIGLDLGPNLAVTGSLSAWLWLEAARTAGARPSLWTYTRLGVVLVPLTLAGSLAALRLSAT